MIERGLLYVVRRGLNDAVKNHAAAVIFDMDTPGGSVGVMEEIIRLLVDLPSDIKTYTFVNKDALSAGALIAMATDEIYMAPGSRIGASAVISILGDIKEGDMKEKIVSATLALVSSAAEHKGHDPRIVEAMMRKEYEFKLGDKVLCAVGQLLTLTDTAAEQMVPFGNEGETRPLLSKGTVSSLYELQDKIGLTNSDIKTLHTTAAEQIARYIEMFSVIFLVGGLLGLYIEFKTPGFGVPGLTGIVLLAIFFWGHNIAGLSGIGEVILFLAGVSLLLVEIFLIPGFGFVGVTGILLIATSLIMALIPHYSWEPLFAPKPAYLQNAVLVVGATFLISLTLMLLLARLLPETKTFKQVMLGTELKDEQGYQASPSTVNLEGTKGIAETALRPAGIGAFGDQRLDVVTHGDFIDKGKQIVIAETHGNRIVVEPV